MSGLAASEEKKTDAVTDFSSSSMPALAAACLTMAWVFWRGALIDVVDHLQLLVALGSNSVGAALPARGVEDLVRLVDTELPPGVPGRVLRRRVEEVRRRRSAASIDLLLHGGAIDEEVQRLADGGVGQERVRRLEAQDRKST